MIVVNFFQYENTNEDASSLVDKLVLIQKLFIKNTKKSKKSDVARLKMNDSRLFCL